MNRCGRSFQSSTRIQWSRCGRSHRPLRGRSLKNTVPTQDEWQTPQWNEAGDTHPDYTFNILETHGEPKEERLDEKIRGGIMLDKLKKMFDKGISASVSSKKKALMLKQRQLKRKSLILKC